MLKENNIFYSFSHYNNIYFLFFPPPLHSSTHSLHNLIQALSSSTLTHPSLVLHLPCPSLIYPFSSTCSSPKLSIQSTIFVPSHRPKPQAPSPIADPSLSQSPSRQAILPTTQSPTMPNPIPNQLHRHRLLQTQWDEASWNWWGVDDMRRTWRRGMNRSWNWNFHCCQAWGKWVFCWWMGFDFEVNGFCFDFFWLMGFVVVDRG